MDHLEDFKYIVDHLKESRILFEDEEINSDIDYKGEQDEFFMTHKDEIVKHIVSTIKFNNMEFNREKDFFKWSGTISNNIKWTFSFGLGESDGFYINTGGPIRIDDSLAEDLKKMAIYCQSTLAQSVNAKK